jgi:hypothetical protein
VDDEAGQESVAPEARDVVTRAFGAESRARMLDQYFASAGEVTPRNAWVHVYRLLLWIDPTMGLAHCYESDKAQPGRPWYARSLAFHEWVAAGLGTTPGKLRESIDWLFRRGTELAADAMARQTGIRVARVAEQLKAYDGKGMPEPGEDPGLELIIREELAPWLVGPVPAEGSRRLAQRVRGYLMQENKRKNLVGEGFEDVLASVILRLPGADAFEVKTRTLLSQLSGFGKPRKTEKERKVDLAVFGPGDRRVLVSAKWSVRADREEQFGSDFEAYARLEALGKRFDFVLVTNEFDAARIGAACERRRENAYLFDSVVHVNPDGVLAAYGVSGRGAALKVPEHKKSGRLVSLEAWLGSLLGSPTGRSRRR